MSNFHRKGTVSKSSGPTHANSYAMKDVPVRYKTPIFVPELLQLPVNWVKPTLPSSRNFNYDYSLEHRVSEQARHRAISIAAEASLHRKQISALLESQKTSAGETTADSAPPVLPHPPFLSSTDILMPTPVAPPAASQSSPVVAERGVNPPAAKGGDQSGSSSAEGGSSTSLIEDESQPAAQGLDKTVFKSLGNWSIKEFEGDAMDPFEIASLQAINDMEELQSVLQQTPPPPPPTSATGATAVTIAAASAAASPAVPQGASSSSPTVLVSSQSRVPTAIPHFSSEPTAIVHSSPAGGPRPSQAMPSSPGMLRSGVVSSPMEAGVPGRPPLSSSPVAQSHSNMATPNQFGTAFSATNPFFPGPNVSGAPSATNPFSFVTPVSGNTSTPNLHQQLQPAQEPQRKSSEPGVGTLVDLGDLLGANTPPANQPVPAPRNSPKIQKHPVPGVLPSSSSPSTVTQGANSPVPVPKPRTNRGSPAPQPRHTPPTTATPTPTPPPAALSQSSSSSNVGKGLPPPVPPKTNSPKMTPAGVSRGSPNFSATHNHVSMGVPVLPVLAPPTTSSQAALPSEPPPAYKQNATPPTGHKGPPPPPYSSPTVYHRPQQPPPPSVRPQVAPKAYTLPNPEASLTMEERAQVQSMAGMGFPPQRVGRAMLRFQGDQTKVLDFLFLVGELEEAKFNGNSAETALIACKDNLEDAKAYLQKLESYKEFGFQEKHIHEAYDTAKGDWDKVLDILTKER